MRFSMCTKPNPWQTNNIFVWKLIKHNFWIIIQQFRTYLSIYYIWRYLSIQWYYLWHVTILAINGKNVRSTIWNKSKIFVNISSPIVYNILFFFSTFIKKNYFKFILIKKTKIAFHLFYFNSLYLFPHLQRTWTITTTFHRTSRYWFFDSFHSWLKDAGEYDNQGNSLNEACITLMPPFYGTPSLQLNECQTRNFVLIFGMKINENILIFVITWADANWHSASDDWKIRYTIVFIPAFFAVYTNRPHLIQTLLR